MELVAAVQVASYAVGFLLDVFHLNAERLARKGVGAEAQALLNVARIYLNSLQELEQHLRKKGVVWAPVGKEKLTMEASNDKSSKNDKKGKHSASTLSLASTSSSSSTSSSLSSSSSSSSTASSSASTSNIINKDSVTSADAQLQMLANFLEQDKNLIQEISQKLDSFCKDDSFFGVVKAAALAYAKRIREVEMTLFMHIDLITMVMMKDVWRDTVQSQVHDLIKDPEGQVFWHRCIGSKNREISFRFFVTAYQNYMSDTYHIPHIAAMAKVFKVTAGLDESMSVSIHDFDGFLHRWGPFRESLAKSIAVCTRLGAPQPWFRAQMSRPEVEKEFAQRSKHENFSWLLRYGGDARQKEFLVWSHTSQRGEIKHVLIQNSPKGYFLKNEAQPQNFPTIVHLLKHYSKENMEIENDFEGWEEETKIVDPQEAATRYQSYDAEDHFDDDNIEGVVSPVLSAASLSSNSSNSSSTRSPMVEQKRGGSSTSLSSLSSSMSSLSSTSNFNSTKSPSPVEPMTTSSLPANSSLLVESALARLRKKAATSTPRSDDEQVEGGSSSPPPPVLRTNTLVVPYNRSPSTSPQRRPSGGSASDLGPPPARRPSAEEGYQRGPSVSQPKNLSPVSGSPSLANSQLSVQNSTSHTATQPVKHTNTSSTASAETEEEELVFV